MKQWIKAAPAASTLVLSLGVTLAAGTVVNDSRAASNTFIPAGAVWKYNDTGTDLGTVWQAPAYDDSTWASGPAQLGYSSNPAELDEATTISFGPNDASKYITAYFRRTFTVANAASYTNLFVQLLRDDGAVIYLNGVEIHRSNMPGGPVAFATLASASVSGADESTFFNSNLPASSLVNGLNVLAVELHQSAANSSDLSFDLQLVGFDTGGGNIPPTVNLTAPADNSTFNAPTNLLLQASAGDSDGTVSKVEFFRSGSKVGEDTSGPNWTLDWTNALVGSFQITAVATDNLGASTVSAPITVNFTGAAPATLIPAGSVWKYLDTGDNLTGTPWTTVGYDDTAWLSGPAELGYGDGGEATVVNGVYPGGQRIMTTYFRRTFNVSNPSDYSFLMSRLLRDDGAVVYVNGVEAFRSNMPLGPIDNNTTASTSVSPEEESTLFFTNTFPSSLLAAGPNVVAVEIHQQNPGSSDISFNFELIGNTGAIINNPPAVGLTSPPGNSTFTEPASITINATAVDGDGSVSKVEFFANGGKIGEDTSSPFGLGWSGVPVGSYTLMAVATDNLGASSTSAPVSVFVTASTAPTLDSKTPAPGTYNSLTQITVQFSEPVDGVNASDLLINTVPASSVTGSNATYTFTFLQPAEGGVAIGFATGHGITDRESPPKPFDASAAAASWTYTLVDNAAPSVVKVDPLPGATLRSLSSVEVTFSEPVGGINPTDLRINGRGATSVNGSGAGPYKFAVTQPATNGLVTVAWTNNHGIRDFAVALNAFAGGSWTYTLATNTIQTNIVISEIMFHPPHNQAAFQPEPLNEEYIELFNRGTNTVNLNGWRIKGGVEFTFPAVTLASNRYLVVAANVQVFANKYPGVTNVVGGWTGKLANSDNDLDLEDPLGQQIDSVHYADSGEWALRRVLPDETAGLPSIEWFSEADGLGKSLELINPRMPNQHGQNWAFSTVDNGTPGRTNSIAATNIAPIILNVAHSPAVPTTTNTVTISARLLDELTTGLSATLFWRLGTGAFTPIAMLDDGAHNDGLINDGVFAVVLPAQTNQAVVEYYVQATDSGARSRTWPGPTDGGGAQGANALFQFDNEAYSGSQPIYRIVMTEADNQALADLNNSDPRSNQRFNASFVTSDGIETRIMYRAGVRLRGAGSRGAQPPNLRIQFSYDDKWKGLSAINLNTLYTHSQLIGSILSRKAGLTSEEAIPVQVRRGGTNAASSGSPQFGSHIFMESRGTEWAENHFPLDPNGNVYTATRPNAGLAPVNPPTPANLEAAGYQKDTNQSDNDYSDVANLLNVLNNTPDAQYPSAVRQAVNAEQWLRYMAVLSLLGYGETSVGSDGQPDDYTLYRGVNDPRFQFFPHDHDTDMGEGDGSRRPPNDTIFRAGDGNSVVNRFLRHPEFVPLYYKELKFQLERTFSLAGWTRTLDQAFSGFPVGSQTIFNMKDWLTNRYNNVWSQIPTNLVVNPTGLSQQNGYLRTTAASLALSGVADVVDTRFVKVNGQPASWTPVGGTWSANVNLRPGINSLMVQTTAAAGQVLQQSALEVWYDDGTVQNFSGAIASDTIWSAANGPYNVTASVTVNAGVTLTIQPGTTVYLGSAVNLSVANGGRLIAEGTDGARIRFTRAPGTATTWGGITVNGAVGSSETRLAYAHFEFNNSTAIHSAGGTLFLDHLTFGNTSQQYVSLDDSSFVVSHCVFPTATAQFELVHGNGGIKSGGRGLFLRNFFGVPIGYNDVVDFTGGNRPGQPIVQFIGNVFVGASDDILDLDGTDGWIQGNIFLHSHKNGSPDSSSAISGGLTGSDRSELTVIGNLFYDVDQVANAKEGNFYTFINNTIVRQTHTGGTDTNGTVALLADVGTAEGTGMYFEGNIIYDAEKLVFGRTNSVVTFTNNIITLLQGPPWSGPGGNNTNADPIFRRVPQMAETTFTSWEQAQVMWSWLSLQPGSPAIGTGPNGRDKGGVVPFGASVSGEPAGSTPQTATTLNVGVNRTGNGIPTSGFPNGSGFTHYRSRLDGGAWSAETPISTPINLSGLAAGPHRVEVSGRLDSGFYQDDPAFGEDAAITSSRTWFVSTGGSTVRLNEVLARNGSAVPVGSKFPDLIELYNGGAAPVSLAGMGVTDEADNPFKFSFPAGTTLAAGQYLVLYADSDATPPGHHLGFSLKQNGDEVFLTAPDGRALDSVTFGLQVADLSIGRTPDGSWQLCRPTFGAPNATARTGDPRLLKINEWLASGITPYPDDFIELFNPDPLPVSLGELFLTDMPTSAPFLHDIAPLSFIPGGGYAIFLADGNTGAGSDHVNFSLNAENGLIALVAANGSLIDCIYYGPQTTDVSMGRQPNGAANYGFFAPPTPGSPNPAIIPPGGTVTINEVLAQNTVKRAPDNTTPDWVELYNPTAAAIDISDMSLSDDAALPRRYVFASGTTIPALGFLAIRCDADIPAGATNTGFGLKQTGQTLYLFDKLTSGGGQLSAVSFGVQAADFSIGRVPNGSTNWVLCAERIGLPNVAATLGNAAGLKVNEWMANPAPGDDDWFEIFNPNPQPVALAGLHLSDNLGTPASRMKHKIAPLSFIGIEGWAYQRFVADNNLAAGPEHVAFGLAAGGEQIGISSAVGTLIDGVSFGAQTENVSQGRLPDGVVNIVGFPGTASPGDPNYALLPNVVISEALTHTDSPLEDAIELQNVSGATVNLSGWYLSNAKHDLARFRIPNGTTIPPGGFKVFYQYQFGETNESAPAVPPLFNLNSAHGDEVYLAQATNDVFTGYRAQASFGAAENGISFGRYVTSVGTADFTAMSARTFGVDVPETLTEFRQGTGRTNTYPKVGPIVISEIMYHPVDNGTNDNALDEFIELRNFAALSVPLYDTLNPANTWKLRDGVSFSFPPNTSIPAGGFLIIVSFDPANLSQLIAFRTKYNIQAGTPVVGPYSGKLDNGGESVELARPDAPQTAPGPDLGLVPYILVDKVRYSDLAPWANCGPGCGPDGGGQSLQRINLNEYGNDPINWQAGSPTPGPQGGSLDSDADGMLDSWEIQYGLTVGVNDSQGDLDGDRMKNIDEFLAGTIPNNPASALRLAILQPTPSAVMQFSAAANVAYVVEFKDALVPGAWTMLQNVPPGSARPVQVVDPAPGALRFYRIRTQ